MHVQKTAACLYLLLAGVSLALSIGKPVRRQVKDPEPEPVLRLINGELVVEGSYMFLFNSDVAMDPEKKNQVYNSFDKKDNIQPEFSFGNMAGFFVFDVSDEKLKELESTVSAFGRFIADKAFPIDYASNSTISAGQYSDQKRYKRSVSGQCRDESNFDYLDRKENHEYGPPLDDCEKIDVYVLDAGVNDHVDFNGRLKACYEYSSARNSNNQVPCHDHDIDTGTHLAGLIGSDTFGITPNVNLYSIRVIDYIQHSYYILLHKITWAYGIAQKQLNLTGRGILYITFSYNGYHADIELLTSDFINKNNVVFITTAARGNSPACNNSLTSIRSVVSVGSVDFNFKELSNSNYGQCIDILALSKNMWSWNRFGVAQTQTYHSIAGAQVAGVIAQYWVQRPELTASNIRENINSKTSPLFDNNARTLQLGTPNKLLRYSHCCDVPGKA